MSHIPGAKGDIIKQKFVAVKKHNPDFEKIQVLRDKMVENHYLPDMCDHKLLMYAPVHTADIERLFSAYQNVVTDKQTILTIENIRKQVIADC